MTARRQIPAAVVRFSSKSRALLGNSKTYLVVWLGRTLGIKPVVGSLRAQQLDDFAQFIIPGIPEHYEMVDNDISQRVVTWLTVHSVFSAGRMPTSRVKHDANGVG